MLLTITTTHFPADDLSYMLHKHPGNIQSVELSAGNALCDFAQDNPNHQFEAQFNKQSHDSFNVLT